MAGIPHKGRRCHQLAEQVLEPHVHGARVVCDLHDDSGASDVLRALVLEYFTTTRQGGGNMAREHRLAHRRVEGEYQPRAHGARDAAEEALFNRMEELLLAELAARGA